jgi:hypothetical protein
MRLWLIWIKRHPDTRSDFELDLWSGERGSNPRPQLWESCALPTELPPRLSSNFRRAVLAVTSEGAILGQSWDNQLEEAHPGTILEARTLLILACQRRRCLFGCFKHRDCWPGAGLRRCDCDARVTEPCARRLQGHAGSQAAGSRGRGEDRGSELAQVAPLVGARPLRRSRKVASRQRCSDVTADDQIEGRPNSLWPVGPPPGAARGF